MVCYSASDFLQLSHLFPFPGLFALLILILSCNQNYSYPYISVYFLLHIPQVFTSDDLSFFSFSSNAPTVLSCQGLYMHFVLKVIYIHSELCVMSDFSSSNSNNSLFILQSDGRNCQNCSLGSNGKNLSLLSI